MTAKKLTAADVALPRFEPGDARDRFHLWSIESVDEAVELFTGVPPGVPDAGSAYGADSVYGPVMAQLEAFDRILAERLHG